MYSRRAVLIAVLSLAASAPCLTAEEPRPGKVRLVHWLKNPDENLAAGGFLADGRLLLGGDNYLRIWNPKTGKEDARFTFTFAKGFTYRFVISPDGKTVATLTSPDKEIRLFDVATGKLLSRIPQTSEVSYVEFAPDGKTLVSPSGGLRLCDVKTGKELRQFRLQLPKNWEGHHLATFSPDGKLLAVALDDDSSVHLCDVSTGDEIRRLFKPVSWLGLPNVAFSPDGRYLAATAFEKFPGEPRILLPPLPHRFVIRLWDVRNGELVRELKQPIPPLPMERLTAKEEERYFYKNKRDSEGLAFSPDGKTLVNCDTVTQLWEVATGKLRHEFDVYTSRGCFSPKDGLLAARCFVAQNPDKSKWKRGHKWKRGGLRLWDWRDPCLPQPKKLGAREIDQLWSDLSSSDAAVGYRAIASLLAHPNTAVAALGARLRRVEPVKPGEVDRLIAALNDDNFSVREKAVERLAALSETARPSLLRVKVQRPSLEVRRRVEDLLARFDQPAGGMEHLRCIRAVEVLETIGTEEARHVLVNLASGAKEAVETKDAQSALQRLNRK